MVSEEIIDMLIDPDPAVRKRGVTTLGKSKDPDALPYLAEVYRDDEDPEVRELARKAGIYIKKNAAPAAPPPVEESSSYTDVYGGTGDSLYEEDDDGDDAYADASDTPLPSEIHVTQAQVERARGLVQQALDLNMRGDNTRAAKTLQKALQINPRLIQDSYTLSLAATITGMSGKEAVQTLAPSDAELKKRATSGGRARRSGLQVLMAYMVIVGGVTALIGYFLFAWVDMTSIETTSDGQVVTIGAAMDELRDEIGTDEAREGLVAFVGEEQADEMIGAMNGLKFEFTGWETTSVTLGWSSINDVSGLTRLAEAFTGLLGFSDADLDTEVETPPPATLDYTLILAPITGVMAIIAGIFLLMGGARYIEWIMAVAVGIIGMVPLVYFYTEAVNAVLDTNDDLGALGQVTDFSGADLIGLGFWVSVAGMVLVVLLPFIAMLTQPQQTDF